MSIEGMGEVRYNMDSNILNYNYAFEVDLEKMEGRYIFNTGEINQKLAEKKMLECCDYKYISSSCTQKNKYKPLIFNSYEIFGLTFQENCMAMGETLTTILVTEKGFICQLMPCFWLKSVYTGDTIFIVTSGDYYPILVTNSLLDI